MALTGAMSLSAGQVPTVVCADARSTKDTRFFEGNLNAILISKSSGAVTSS
jgi:hypothetical protein